MAQHGSKHPALTGLPQNGILFNNAYTPNAKSSPSRACFLTGRYSWQLEEACNHVPFFPSKFKTFMEALDQNGYYTGYTAKGWAPGVANDSTGNPRLMTGTAFNSKTLDPPADGISNIDYAGNFSDFLDPGKITSLSASGTGQRSLTGNMNMAQVLKKGEKT